MKVFSLKFLRWLFSNWTLSLDDVIEKLIFQLGNFVFNSFVAIYATKREIKIPHETTGDFSIIFKFNLALVFPSKIWRSILSKISAYQPWALWSYFCLVGILPWTGPWFIISNIISCTVLWGYFGLFGRPTLYEGCILKSPFRPVRGAQFLRTSNFSKNWGLMTSCWPDLGNWQVLWLSS